MDNRFFGRRTAPIAFRRPVPDLAARALSLALLVLTGTDTSAADDRVGVYGEPSRLEIRGADTWTPEDIVRGLSRSPGWFVKAHPRASLEEYLDHVAAAVRSGYLRGGFLAPDVNVTLDREHEHVVVAIEEGKRVRAGPVVVAGNRSVPKAAIARRLTSPKRAPSGKEEDEALWTEGDPARCDPDFARRAREAVAEVYGRAGFLEPEIGAGVRVGADQTAELLVKVVDEGPRFRLREVRFRGDFEDDREELLRILEIEPGQTASTDIVGDTLGKLEDLGRYLSAGVEIAYAEDEPLVDLVVELDQAPFAPPLSAGLDEERQVLRRTVDWLNSPEKWSGGLFARLRIEAGIDFVGRPLPHEYSFELALHPRSLGMRLDREEDDGKKTTLLALVLGDGPSFLFSESIGLVTWPSAERRPRAVVEGHLDVSTESENRFTFVLGGGFKLPKAGAPPLEIGLETKDVVLTRLVREDVSVEIGDSSATVRPVAKEPSDTAPPGCEFSVELATGRLEGGCRRHFRDGSSLEVGFEKEPLEERWETLFRRVEERRATSMPLYRFLAGATAGIYDAFFDPEDGSVAALETFTEITLGRAVREGGPVARAFGGLFSSADEEGGPFRPLSAERPESVAGALAFFAQLLASELAPSFPSGSWPRTVLREAACILAGQAEHTGEELQRLAASGATGPVGFWVVAEGLGAIDQRRIRRLFATIGLEQCNPGGFEKEVELLRETAPEWFEELGLAVAVTDAVRGGRLEPEAARRLLDEIMAEPLATAQERLVKAGIMESDHDLRRAGEEVLRSLWSRVEERLRARLLRLSQEMEA